MVGFCFLPFAFLVSVLSVVPVVSPGCARHVIVIAVVLGGANTSQMTPPPVLFGQLMDKCHEDRE